MKQNGRYYTSGRWKKNKHSLLGEWVGCEDVWTSVGNDRGESEVKMKEGWRSQWGGKVMYYEEKKYHVEG